MGHAAQWQHRQRQWQRGVHQTGTEVLPAGHRIAMVRADAGFFEKRFLEHLEKEQLPYIIVARLTAVVRKLVIHRIPSTAWRVVTRGVEVADLEASLPNWRGAQRRFVCLRQEVLERPRRAADAW